VSTTSSDLELVGAGSPQAVGLRFTDLAIPADATIVEADIQFTVDEKDDGSTTLTLRAMAADDAGPFSRQTYDVSSRPTTAAAVTWTPSPWSTVGEAGPDQRTPDLAAILQEVVGRPQWQAGNSIAIMITGSGERTAESWDGDASSAAVLSVTYTESSNTKPVVNISSPQDEHQVASGDPTNFSATATDGEDGEVSATLVWTSNLVGPIGSGPSLVVVLEPGMHVVTATATDSDGRSGSDSIVVAVFSTQPILIGAGDISACDEGGDEATAAILDSVPGAHVFTAGDNAYPDGTAAQFAECYEPTWGRYRVATRPSAGNHDYHTAEATDYFAYFGTNAGTPGEGWYSYDLGTWHVVVLNSNCSNIGGCDRESAQADWLIRDLAANTAKQCTVAYWHHPRFSSGNHGSSTELHDLWSILYDYGADVVMNGHDHVYERLEPLNPDGIVDPTSGIRQFVVGTGGKSLSVFTGPPLPTTVVRDDTSHGVLRLDLSPGTYIWEFIPVPGATFADSGNGTCVDPADGLAVVSITAPGDGSVFVAGDPVVFAASAVDPEDGDISANLSWTSDVDGSLGGGEYLSITDLSVGAHTISTAVVDGGGRLSLDTITITIEPGPGNQPPVISAGQDMTVVLGDDVMLEGSGLDDGLPNPPGVVTFAWSLVSGPGSVVFSSPDAPMTGMTVSAPGLYVVALSGFDGEHTGTDTATVTVLDPEATQTIESRVGRSSDDAEESADGDVSYASGDLDLVNDGSDQIVGIRFGSLDIPSGATITAAHIQFTSDETSTSKTDLIVHAQAADDPAPFSAIDFDISLRPLTAAFVAWSPGSWDVVGEAGAAQRTPDLSAVIQEVVDRPGSVPGNAAVFIISGSGRRVAMSFEGSSVDAPLLHIEYLLPSAARSLIDAR
jgi:hypothetical protein